MSQSLTRSPAAAEIADHTALEIWVQTAVPNAAIPKTAVTTAAISTTLIPTLNGRSCRGSFITRFLNLQNSLTVNKVPLSIGHPKARKLSG